MKPLHDLDQIKADEALKKRTLHAVMNKKTKKKSYAIPSIVGALTCLVLALVLQFIPSEDKELLVSNDVYAYVSVDINPSMEFQLDKNNKVVNIISYNDDAQLILDQEDFKGLTIQETISSLLANDMIKDYMNSGYMQVSVYSDDKNHSLALEKELDISLSKELSQSQYGCSCVSSEDHQAASNHHMSFGKYQAIELILEIDDKYSLEELNNMSMYDIKEIYESLSGESFPENQRNGHGNGGNHHGRGNHE